MIAKESTNQWFPDKLAICLKVGDCAMYDLERFVLHNDRVGLCQHFDIVLAR